MGFDRVKGEENGKHKGKHPKGKGKERRSKNEGGKFNTKSVRPLGQGM